MVKSWPAVQETQVPSLGQEESLEKGMATHSSILAWRVLGKRSLAGYSPWGRKRVGLDLVTKPSLSHTFSISLVGILVAQMVKNLPTVQETQV